MRARGNIDVNNDARTNNSGVDSGQNTKGQSRSRNDARKRVHAQRGAIDKGLDRKVDRHVGTCNEKVFRFRVCGAGAIRIALELARKGDIRGVVARYKRQGKTWNVK